jgi:hypothetical protein
LPSGPANAGRFLFLRTLPMPAFIAAQGMESYFDFFEKNIKAAPWLDTDLNEKMKTFTEQNIAAASEFAQKASKAKDFQDYWRIQTEFMQAQWKAFTEQTKELAESAIKSATKVMKSSS